MRALAEIGKPVGQKVGPHTLIQGFPRLPGVGGAEYSTGRGNSQIYNPRFPLSSRFQVPNLVYGFGGAAGESGRLLGR